jgi:hypothetical protein
MMVFWVAMLCGLVSLAMNMAGLRLSEALGFSLPNTHGVSTCISIKPLMFISKPLFIIRAWDLKGYIFNV